MNKSELKAYKWLIRQGILEDEITYHRRGSPDFELADGRGYEVKRLYKDRILFRRNQYDELKKRKDVTIVVFRDDKDEPIAQIPMAKLERNKIVEGILIYVVQSVKAVKVSEYVYNKLDEIKKDFNHQTFDSVFRELIHCYNLHYRKKKGE